jgi:hypothetical protein
MGRIKLVFLSDNDLHTERVVIMHRNYRSEHHFLKHARAIVIRANHFHRYDSVSPYVTHCGDLEKK